MATGFSSNWKKLQARLKDDTQKTRSRNIRPLIEERERPPTKRRRVGDRQARADSYVPRRLARQRRQMDEEPSSGPATSASLAVDRDLSTNELAASYRPGFESKISQPTHTDHINAGLLTDVEVGQYIAMDCEMVGVGAEEDRSVLARVSVVNYHGMQVYDSFVRPEEFVTDWRTHVSGVSAKNMTTARSFEDVQKDVAALLKDRVLVGHAIKNDLEVLMLGHPAKDIRDTSKFVGFRKFSAGRTPALKRLAKEVLGVEIQEGEHSSIEDARATMLLFRQHRQAFDAEHAKRFPQHRSAKSKPRKNGKKR